MCPNEFEFDFESILAEFSGYSEGIGEEKPSVKEQEQPVSLENPEKAPREQPKLPEEKPVSAGAQGKEAEEDPFHSLKTRLEGDRSRREAAKPSREKSSPEPKRSKEQERHSLRPAQGAAKPVPHIEKKALEEREKTISPLTPLLGIVCSVLLLLGLVWVGFNVHPGASAAAGVGSEKQKLDMTAQLDTYLNNMASDAMGELVYIKKVYKIDENATFGPAPDQSKYGSVEIADAAKVLDVIQTARDYGLLDNQEVCFDPNANFYHLSNIQYYCDETILVICWKEQIEGKVCSFAEVKIADASQFRRKITEDKYGSSVKQYASQLSESANAVVAMNADFYAFRQLGMVVYQRELYRYSDGKYSGIYKSYNSLDHCFIDGKGDLILMHRGTELTREQMEQYIKDKDILFGLAFGPILVENGEIKECTSYPAGEINTEYSRAGIGQLDTLHYLFMSVNWSDENTPRATVGEFGRIFHSKGVKTAYCLDGGQTSEIVMNDIPFNRIDFNAERTVSDIIYFATAIPESEVTK